MTSAYRQSILRSYDDDLKALRIIDRTDESLQTIQTKKVTVSTVNTYAVPMSASTKLVRLCTDTPAQWLVAGSSTAATSTARFLPANSPEYFYVNPSDVLGVIKQV